MKEDKKGVINTFFQKKEILLHTLYYYMQESSYLCLVNIGTKKGLEIY